jgi:mono/diheme cytochrome c family protein
VVQTRFRPVARRAAVLFGVALVVAGVATGALASRTSTPQPNATLGQTQFTSAGCGACHMFAAARSKGKIGPDLDAPSLTVQQIIQQVTLGGYTILGNAAKKQYPFPMSAFKGKLSASEIQNIAAFVFIDRNPKAVPKGASIPITYGSSGGKSSGSSSSSSSSSSTSTTSSGGGGGASLANNGCPAGQTIQTSGATDNDGDEGGAPSDNDGCI